MNKESRFEITHFQGSTVDEMIVNANRILSLGYIVDFLHSKWITYIYGWHLFLYAHFLIPSLLPCCLWYAIMRINWGLWSCAVFNSVFWQRGPAPGKTIMPTDTKLWHTHAQSRLSIIIIAHPTRATESESALLQPHTVSLKQIMTKVRLVMLNEDVVLLMKLLKSG